MYCRTLLQREWENGGPSVSNGWTKFIQKHPNLHLHSGNSTAGVRIDAVNADNLRAYYALLRGVYDEHESVPFPGSVTPPVSESAPPGVGPPMPSLLGSAAPSTPSLLKVQLRPRLLSPAVQLYPRLLSSAVQLRPRLLSSAVQLRPRLLSSAVQLSPRLLSSAVQLHPHLLSLASLDLFLASPLQLHPQLTVLHSCSY